MSDYKKLKDLLFGAESKALESITDRVKLRENRTPDVADVLPDAVRLSHSDGAKLVDSLTPPVDECVQKAIRDDPETYSEVLYPVVGPAIRKAVAHALRSLSQQINQALEHSLTPKGLQWRIEAARAGIPFGEFVIQKTLLFRVEQAFLISRENGLLIEHVDHLPSTEQDGDAVSAMFTAIQDFIKESFSPDKTGRLESADMGEFTLWAVHGPHALLVCVIRGTPPRNLRRQLNTILEQIHSRYDDQLKSFDGDDQGIAGVESELEKCLTFLALQGDSDDKKVRRWPFFLIPALAVAIIGYLWFDARNTAKTIDTLAGTLNTTPGYFIADVEQVDGRFVVRGLRDPLAISFATAIEGTGIDRELIVADFSAYQSLHPEIVARRSADTVIIESPAVAETDARADELLALNNEVSQLSGSYFEFGNGTVFVPGHEAELRSLCASLQVLKQRAESFNLDLELVVIGSTDSTGNRDANAILAMQRAQRAAEILAEFQLMALTESRSGTAQAREVADVSGRHVRVTVQLTASGK